MEETINRNKKIKGGSLEEEKKVELSEDQKYHDLKTGKWYDLMYGKKIHHILEDKNRMGISKPLLSFSAHLTKVGDALRQLKDNGLFAAPVFLENTMGERNTSVFNYMGMVGVHEILLYLLAFFKDAKTIQSTLVSSGKVNITTWKNSAQDKSEFIKNTPIIDVLEALSMKRYKPYRLYQNDSMAFMTKILEETNYSRVPVIQDDAIVGMISTTDLLRNMIESSRLLPSLFFLTLDEFADQLIDKDYIKVTDGVLTAHLLDQLENHSKHSAAIADSLTKELYTNFSITDIKGIVDHNIDDLQLPLKSFIQNFKPINKIGLISVSRETPLIDMFKLMVDSKIHGIWVTNDQDHSQVEGYISYPSIVKFIYGLVRMST